MKSTADLTERFRDRGRKSLLSWRVNKLSLLEEHRETILGRVHEEERQIVCLDYLVYRIRNRKKQTQ